MRPETQEDVHSLIIVADDEGSVDAMIMRETPILNVNELCIVDFVDLKMGNNPSSSVQSVAVGTLSMTGVSKSRYISISILTKNSQF